MTLEAHKIRKQLTHAMPILYYQHFWSIRFGIFPLFMILSWFSVLHFLCLHLSPRWLCSVPFFTLLHRVPIISQTLTHGISQ